MDGYEYDLFISYRRNGNVRDWMRNHLAPRLRECLVDELPREPRIFLDVELDVGTRWPDEIARALHRSHLLLAVWSPSYFTSHWCLAEWQTMRRREEILGTVSYGTGMGSSTPSASPTVTGSHWKPRTSLRR